MAGIAGVRRARIGCSHVNVVRVTATYSRTAGETVAGSPYTISATLSPAGVLGNYSITYNTASKTYGDADPAFTGTLTNFVPADGVTATYSHTVGETVAGKSLHDQRDAVTSGRAGQLRNHVQHGGFHHQSEIRLRDAECSREDLRQ